MSKFMDTLGDLSGSDSGDDEEAPEEDALPALKRKKKTAASEPAPEDLERLGYKSGPSILHVPEPKDSSEPTWEWGKGSKAEGAEEEQERYEDREHTRHATGSKLEETARLQRLAQEQARQAKMEARQERERLANEARLTFKQKEKRKRELGQAKGGKGNYVEEEKRIARQFGVYSGFD
ncbi:hypothetical protein COCOBI_09-4080 [Coccomyxa sp. Obi]|nr:hypothetical protein COCOBI_09-4080 [Coccomyxa sp. Obi]